MSKITTRSGKGAPLTNTELDSNFTNLNTDKVEKTSDQALAASDALSVNNDTITLTKGDGSTESVSIADANTWRPVVNALTSTSSSHSLSANQGRILKAAIDDIELTWNKVTNKPTSFPPASHSHSWDSITGKPSSFTPSSHSHSWSSITGKPSTFAPSSHTHTHTALDMHFGRNTQNIDTYDPDSFWGTSRSTGGSGTYPNSYVNVYNFAGNGSSEGTQLATYYGDNNKTWIRTRSDTTNTWLSWTQIFTDEHHPNADKWTTARNNNINLTGDVTGYGSASVDGTGNWTVNVNTTVANDSHNHDHSDGNFYVGNNSGAGLYARHIYGKTTYDRNPDHLYLQYAQTKDVYVGGNSGTSHLQMSTGTVKFADVNRYWLSTASNWGLYWDTSNNQLEMHGAGNARFNFDLDDGKGYNSYWYSYVYYDRNDTAFYANPAGTSKFKDIHTIATNSNPFRWQRSSPSQTGQDDNVSVYVDDSNIYFTHNNDDDGDASGFRFRRMVDGSAQTLFEFDHGAIRFKGSNIYRDNYHPEADTWTTPRTHTVTLTGDVTGSASQSVDGSGNRTWTISTQVGNDSHTHHWNNIQGKPSTFPPSSHSHSWSSITGKPPTFTPSSHTHDRLHTTWQTVDLNTVQSGDYQMSYEHYSLSSSNKPPGCADNANAVLTANTHSSNYRHQLAFNSNEQLYYRAQAAGSWTGWRKLYHTGDFDIGNYDTRSVSDGRYVRKSGDTMTGTLTAPRINCSDVYINSASGAISRITNENNMTIYSDHIIDFRESDANALRAQFGLNGAGNFSFGSGGIDTSYRMRVRGNMRVDSDLRAIIYYDLDNTGYYADPASTSRFNAVNANSYQINGAEIVDSSRNIRNINQARDDFGAYFLSAYHSGSDFVNGTLVKTDIPASSASGASFVLEATGKSYSSRPPFNFMVQGYLYNNTIINYSGVNNGDLALTQVKAFEHEGKLCFWWARIGYWHSFEVRVRDAGGNGKNRVSTIVNSTEPTGSKKVTINLSRSMQYNMNSNAGDMYAKKYFDSDNTAYYGDFASTSRMNAITTNKIHCVGSSSNTAPRWDTSFHVVQSQHWYGHSSSQTLYLGESGNKVRLRGTVNIGSDADCQSGYKASVRGSLHMNNAHIHYINEAHFNNGFRFKTQSNNTLQVRSDSSSSVNLRLLTAGNTRGYVAANSSNEVGFLDVDGHWAYKHRNSVGHWFYVNNVEKAGLGNDYLWHNNQIRAPIFYDKDNTAYYFGSGHGDFRFRNGTVDSLTAASTTINGNLSVTGNTTLGNGNGDTTRVNDILYVQATDSGDAHFHFGENSSNGYGAYWHWDSGYRMTLNSRNAGTNSAVYYFDTNSTTYLNMGRSIHMHNKSIDYVTQLHFNDNVRFYDDGNDNYLNFKWGDTGAGGIKFYDGNTTLHGYVYGDGGGKFGLLDKDSHWFIRTDGASYTEIRSNNNVELTVSNSYVTAHGSMRSPVFYDADNTGYYGNFASTSNLNNLNVQGTLNVNGKIGNVINNAYMDFTVNGDANTYYPVNISSSGQYAFQNYSISRGYSWTAPSTWNTSSHKGGLTLTWQNCGDGAWGGNDKAIRIIQFAETYTTMVGGMALSTGGTAGAGVIVWLRGGGAKYRLHTPQGSAASVRIHLSSVTASNGATYAPRSYSSSTVSNEIYNRFPVRGTNQLYHENSKVIAEKDVATSGANKVLKAGSNGYLYIDNWIRCKNGTGLHFPSGVHLHEQSGYTYSAQGIQSGSDMRAPVFYDRNNTSYYIHGDSESRLNTLRAYGYRRWNHHSGHLEGSYNNVGANSYKSNPIYTIGSSYNPSDAALGNMYGIGFSHSNASFISGSGFSGWGMYVTSAGTARVYLSGESGHVAGTGNTYFETYYDRNNTGYYANPASTSVFNDFRCDIMYDKDNTSYYVRPGSTSIFNAARANIWYSRSNTGYYSDPEATSNMLFIQMPHRGNGTPNLVVNNGGSENWRAIDIDGGNNNHGIGTSGTSRSKFSRNSLCFHTSASDSIRFHSDGWDTTFEVTGATGEGWMKGHLKTYGYQGHGNVGGTGSASWHPSGIYSAGTNWLYGTSYMDYIHVYQTYDRSNTAYYSDPGSTTKLNVVNANSGNIVNTSSNNASGYHKCTKTGVITQWAYIYCAKNNRTTWTYPTAFPNACRSVSYNAVLNSTGAKDNTSFYSVNRTSASLVNGHGGNLYFYVMAIGY